MKTITIRGAVVLAVATLALSALPEPTVAQTTMKIGLGTINDVQHEWAKQFAARMAKQGPGKLKIEIYPAEQIGSQQRMSEGLGMGTLEALIGPPEFLVGIDPRFQIMGAPGVVKNVEHAQRLAADTRFRDALFTFAESKGIKGIGLIVYGPVTYVSRKAVRNLTDFKGMKIRVMASSMHTIEMEKLGATGVAMNPADALQALGAGAIDANRSAMAYFVAFKYFDVVKFATQLDGDALVYSMFAVGKNWFAKLPADTQKMIINSATMIEPEVSKFSFEQNKIAEATWRERGAELVKITGPDQAEFVKRAQSVGKEVAAKNPRIKEAYELMIDRAKATLK